MAGLSFLYILTVLVTGVPAIFQTGFMVGLCGTVSPILALIGGGGITGAMREESSKFAAAVFGIILLAGSLFWTWNVGWHINLFGLHISGVTENLAGFVVGLIFGRRDRV